MLWDKRRIGNPIGSERKRKTMSSCLDVTSKQSGQRWGNRSLCKKLRNYWAGNKPVRAQKPAHRDGDVPRAKKPPAPRLTGRAGPTWQPQVSS
jgi:hypothetical protein